LRCLLFFIFCFAYHVDLRHLHSFPTRRSSDLSAGKMLIAGILPGLLTTAVFLTGIWLLTLRRPELGRTTAKASWAERLVSLKGRSEEHTSELQSRENLVCRLLLEKKNKKQNNI